MNKIDNACRATIILLALGIFLSSSAMEAPARQKKIMTINSPGKEVRLVPVKNNVTVFQFTAEWCGPCTNMNEKLDPYIEKRKGVYLRKIDIKSWSSPVCKQYGIKSVPQFRVYNKKGEFVYEQKMGYTKLRRKIENLLKE